MPVNTDKIGPMGYYSDDNSLFGHLLKDKRMISKMQEENPALFMPRPKKAVDSLVMAKVREALAKDGFNEQSMSVRYLSIPIFEKILQWRAQIIGSCFPAGTMIRMADGSQKPIEKISVFNRVLTAEGNTSFVSVVMGREVNEDIVELKLWGHTNGLKLTKEHPVLTKRGYIKANELTKEDMVCLPRFLPQTKHILETHDHVRLNQQMRRRIAAGDIVGEHRTFGESVKVYRKVPEQIELDAQFGWLIGVALAEGGTDGNKVVFTFNSNEENTLAQKVVDIFYYIFDIEASKVIISEKNTCKVSVHSVAWASLFDSLIGKKSHGKRLHADLASGPKEFLQGVWEGWLAGDGHDPSYKNKVQGTTVSKQLALDMFAIAHGLGLEPTFNGTQPKISHGVKSRKRRYDVCVSGSSLCSEIEEGRTWKKVREINLVPFKGKVYNFEVEGDNSYVADNIGVHNCVASGAMRVVTYRSLAEILIFGDAEVFLGYQLEGIDSIAPFAPYHYGCGRKRGGLRRGDGSFCGAQIEAFQKDGILPCSAKGLQQIVGTRESDYPEPQNASLYRSFGSWNYLDQLRPEAIKITLVESEMLGRRDVDRAKTALVDELKPMMICSSWGFAPQYKHKDGFWVYRRSGSWAHNMSITGFRLASDGNWFVEVTNSWGPDAHRDGEYFYIPIEVFESWLGQANCATIGEIDMTDAVTPDLI